MTAQTSLPGVAVPTANRATLESDLRGETAVCLMALMTWAEFHGGRTALIDGTIERFVTAGKPADPQITRAITNTRSALARYLERNGTAPAWLPASVLELINTPWCAADSAPSSAPRTDSLPTCSPTESTRNAAPLRGCTAANS